MSKADQWEMGTQYPRGLRCLAFSIDLIIIVAFGKLGAYLAGFSLLLVSAAKGLAPQLEAGSIHGALNMGHFFFFCSGLYFNYGLLQGMTGSSFGKHVCGLVVVTKDYQKLGILRSWTRTLNYLASILPLGLGFLMALVDGKMRSLHDRMSATLVVDRDALERGEFVQPQNYPEFPSQPATPDQEVA